MTDRRNFSRQMLAAGAVAALPQALLAQAAGSAGSPLEGQQFRRVKSHFPTTLEPGKRVEVVEFFSYGSRHCYDLLPQMEGDWLKRVRADVQFRRVPVGDGGRSGIHQKLFYALEAMGRQPMMHRKVFEALQTKPTLFDLEDGIRSFGNMNGLDGDQLVRAVKSVEVNIKVKDADRRFTAPYGVTAVPAMGVQGSDYMQGRYYTYTDPSLSGGFSQMLHVVDFLITIA